MTADVSFATSKRSLRAEVQRLTDLIAWYQKLADTLLRGADKDLEKIELLEAQNRALWQQVEEARG